jgi:filamentous hemagglutinin
VLDASGSPILDPTSLRIDPDKSAPGSSPFLFNTSVYTAGKAEVNRPYGSLAADPSAGLYPGEFPLDGGDLTIYAGHNIQGALTQSFTQGSDFSDTSLENTTAKQTWLIKQGQQANPTTGLPAEQTAWGIDFARYSLNVGAFGGGNVHVNAGTNINDLGVVMPTTGKQLGKLKNPDDPLEGFKSNVLKVDGGSQLQVNAGGDIAGGLFSLGKGNGNINADGAITGSSSGVQDANNPFLMQNLVKGPQLLLGDTDLTLTANNGIAISAVSDPMVLATKLNFPLTDFFSYSADSALHLKSWSGDIGLNQDSTILVKSYETNGGANILPASLETTAFGGSINVPVTFLTLFPSPKANLSFLAAQNISGGTVAGNSVLVSDADTQLLPTALAPAIGVFGEFSSHALVPIHRGDQEPIRVVSKRGDIENLTFNLPKKALIASGHDLKNADIAIQHSNLSGDVSVVSAARDIVYTQNRDSGTGELVGNSGGIAISGPGDVLIKSGRDIDFGQGTGLSTVGNTVNPSLGSSGANLTVLAGLNGAEPNYLGLGKLAPDVAKYAENFNKYQQLVIEFMRERTGNTKLTAKTALDDFNKLKPAQYASLQPKLDALLSTKYTNLLNDMKQEIVQFVQQREHNPALSEAEALAKFTALKPDQYLPIQARLNTLADEILFSELNQTGSASAADPTLGNERGFAAINALYPGNAWKGDLKMFFSQIKTTSDGNINLLVPGGEINVGLASPPSELKKTPDQLGIIVQGTGNLNAFLKNDFTVNQSRVFTLGGGDITIWASEGDIDAGRGAKSSLAAPNQEFSVDQNGNQVVTIPPPVSGSGIRTAKPIRGNMTAGNVGLFAPKGIVNAAEAGIGGNNVTISATAVLGANNIQIGGISTGVPAASSVSLAAGLTGVSNLTANVSQMAQASTDMNKDKDNNKKKQLGTISVELIGFGA